VTGTRTRSSPPASESFLWHDYETFGSDARRDRPAEFACWRTDASFEPIAEPVQFRCQPTLDYLPDPQACAITGIGPETALRDGLTESEFAGRVLEQMIEAQTCTVGYNSMRFDDEVTRHLYWRNFIDPYEREWARGNSRFDLIDLTRAYYALRPDGVAWPVREDGHPSFRLTDLTAANALPHRHAHAALSDVEATLALARRLRSAQPRLIDYALTLRRKARVLELLDWQQRTPVVHVSQRFPAERGCLAIVVPLALHPAQAGKVIVADSFVDPAPLLTWSPERLAETLFLPASDPAHVALGLKLVHANRAPFLAPLSVLGGADLQRIRLDRERCDANTALLRSAVGLDARVQQVYRLLERSAKPPQDADVALYDGFVADGDRALMQRFRRAAPVESAKVAAQFRDARLRTLAFRYRARHHADVLDAAERRVWIEYCRHSLMAEPRPLSAYAAAIEASTALAPAVAAELRAWGERVRLHAGLEPREPSAVR
jgi:exodeoxyribonuclease-1